MLWLEFCAGIICCVFTGSGGWVHPDFVRQMDSIVKDIRDTEKDFPIQVVAALDDVCMACPNRGESVCQAAPGSNEHVLSMDEKAIRHLGLNPGETYQKSELVALTANKVDPSDLDYICKGCSWLSYGVCKEGIQDLKKT